MSIDPIRPLPPHASYDDVSSSFEGLIVHYKNGLVGKSDAAAYIAGTIEAAFMTDRVSQDMLSGLLWAAWDSIVSTASRSGDDERSRLVDLLVEINDRGLLLRDGHEKLQVWQRNEQAWDDLPLFGAIMREAWNWGAPPESGLQTWSNLNAFAAQLTSTRRKTFDYTAYAIWVLQEALEKSGVDQRILPTDHLPAILRWFERCGTHLAAQAQSNEQGMSPARWELWRRELAVIAPSKELDGWRARRALDLMTAAESGNNP